MTNPHLATYLNDHLAGSEAGLGILRHLESEQPDTSVAEFAAGLRTEIEADRVELEGLMARLGVARSVPRRATAWVAERLVQIKLRLDDPGGGDLRLLEMLEALHQGIEGKHALWRALEAASDVNMALRPTDFARLRQRAEGQAEAVEKFRQMAAKKALGSPPVAEKG